MSLRVLDLFSGIGGFSLGLKRAGMMTVAFCEIEPFCRRVLAKHWPDVPCYEDVRELTAARLRDDGIECDVICGGFPCQPFSSASAGKRSGQADDRYLWPHMLRLVEGCRPSWVIGENVADIDGLALEQVVSELEACGYQVATFEIPACAVGHDHRRARVWICGHSDRDGQPGRAKHAEVARLQERGSDSGGLGAAHGVSGRMDRARLSALGNSVVPQIPEAIGRAILEVPL